MKTEELKEILSNPDTVIFDKGDEASYYTEVVKPALKDCSDFDELMVYIRREEERFEKIENLEEDEILITGFGEEDTIVKKSIFNKKGGN